MCDFFRWLLPSGWLLTTREHLKDFDLIDVDNWIELVDPLLGDYRF